jgi:hypothetical protein
MPLFLRHKLTFVVLERNKKASEATIFMMSNDGIQNVPEAIVTTQTSPYAPPSPSITLSPSVAFSPNSNIDHHLLVHDDVLQDMEFLGQETDSDLSYLLATEASWTSSPRMSNLTTNPNPISISNSLENGQGVPENAIQRDMLAVGAAADQATMDSQWLSPSLPQTHSSSSIVSENWHGPLHIASRNGNDDIIKLLMQHGVDSNEKDSDGNTPLMLAVVKGYQDVAETLLSHGARISDTDENHCNALHLAVQHRRRDILKMLTTHCAGNAAVTNSYDGSGKSRYT